MKKNLGPLFIVFAAFLWSLDGVLRRSLYTLPALSVVFYEHLFGAIVLLPILFKTAGELRKLSIREIGSLGWISLWGGLLGTFFYTTALAQTNFIPFSVVVLLQQLQPIFAIFLAWLVLKEKITPRFLFWAALAMVGAYLVTFKDLVVNLETGMGTIVAAALALGAAFSWGSSTVFGKHVLNKIHFSTTAALRFALTCVFAVPFLLGFGQFVGIADLTGQQLATLVGITFSTGMVALVIYYYGLRQVEAKVSTICEMFWPLSAVFVDLVFFRTVFSLTQILGGALLLIAIYKVSALSAADPDKDRRGDLEGVGMEIR